MTRPERSAVARVSHTLYLSIGVASLIYAGLVSHGEGGFIQQFSQFHPLYSWALFIFAIGIPASLAVLSYLLPLKALRAIATTAALGFVALQLLAPVAIIDAPLDGNVGPWTQGINAISAFLLVVSYPKTWVFLYSVSQAIIVPVVGITLGVTPNQVPILDGLGALVFCSILTAIGIAIMRIAQHHDELTAQAREDVTQQSKARAMQREQARIDGLIHDDVMSVLLAASRGNNPAALQAQAVKALATIQDIARDSEEGRNYYAHEAVALLRSTALEHDPRVDISVSVSDVLEIPAPAFSALSDALEESLRNSVRHAGDRATRQVTIIVDRAGLTALVQDNGVGFSKRTISPRRLGISMSIVERMRQFPGSYGTVDSQLGAGVLVTLHWSAVDEL